MRGFFRVPVDSLGEIPQGGTIGGLFDGIDFRRSGESWHRAIQKVVDTFESLVNFPRECRYRLTCSSEVAGYISDP